MSLQDPIVIVSMARTPMGALLGSLSSKTASDLGSVAIKATLDRAGIAPEKIDEVIMGCVLPAGQGQAPARQASIKAGLPFATGATTVNKMCGSGMKAVMLAHDNLLAGSHHIMVAGGMESMSNAPHLLLKARQGFRLGHANLKDHMFYDGLEDIYEPGKLMGCFAEETASHFHFTREEQDEVALRSLTRAKNAQKSGQFRSEIIPIEITTRDGTQLIEHDEHPQNAKPEKIPTLKPAFDKNGTVTPANSSAISDGAAALLLMRESTAKKLNLPVLAKIVAHATFSQEPKWFTTAPIGCIQKLCAKAGWTHHDVDLFEINEAFAVVALAAIRELNLPIEKVNIHGGACALGHPIGASGARLIVTLLAALQEYDLKRGIATLCLGGGEAVGVAIER